jgi:hypothetical protein
MADQPYPDGNGYPLGPEERFQLSILLPRLRLAHPNNGQNSAPLNSLNDRRFFSLSVP